MTEAPEPACSACGQPYWLRNGCTSPFVAHTYVSGAEPHLAELVADGTIDSDFSSWPCSDCGARSGEVHHLGCSQAYCTRTGEQMLTCDCDQCSEANEMGYLASQGERRDRDWETPE